MKCFNVVILLLAFCCSISLSQNNSLKPESIISLKAGYHTSYRGINENIPHGFCLDATAEVHTGKNWYIGFNYDLSFGSEDALDYSTGRSDTRSFTIHNYSPIIKYRFPLSNGTVYSAVGIGGSKVYYRYGNSGSGSNALIMFNFRVGGEYYLSKSVLVSLETVFIEAGEIDVGGGGRNFRFFQFKTGITFVLK